MRTFIVVSLFLGVALGSPIGQVADAPVTTVVPDLARSDILDDATTVVVEIVADEAVTTDASVTQRYRQEDGDEESGEDVTTPSGAAAGAGAGAAGASPSGQRRPVNPSIPQPFANQSNFLQEYQFSSQFNLGPKDQSVPLVGSAVGATPVQNVAPIQAQQTAQVAEVAQAQPAVAPVVPASEGQAAAVPAAAPAAPVAPIFPPAVPQAANPSAANPTVAAAGVEDEDDVDSDELDATQPSVSVRPNVREQQREQQEQLAVLKQQERQNQAQRQGQVGQALLQQQQQIEQAAIVDNENESDSDNEIVNDDITTVKSFASEYEYTVQQLGNTQRSTESVTDISNDVDADGDFPTAASLISSGSSLTTVNRTGLQADLDIETGVLNDGDGRAACECGKLPFRVPIGEEAEINLRPWTVAIVRGGLIAGGRPHCAGVLINDRYVLTSASCMEGLHPNGVQVWLTAHSTLDNHHINVGTSKLNVLEVIIHPNFRRGSHDNDIALIKMGQPVDITTSSSYFTPICLPSSPSFDYTGRYGQIFGWGNARVNRICQQEMPILANDICKRDSTHSARLTDNMMCAGFLTPPGPVRTEDCIPDAGGPLSVHINGRQALIGITSWGFEIQNRGHTPTVFTKVAGYADWILHNTDDADWCAA